ncbi:MAG: bifunctional oligoribonuclease/PAP phosphatase NrnA [bacterium]
MNDYAGIIDRLKGAGRFLVASHYSPDGDGIGSTLALGNVLSKMGKDVVLYNRDGVPANLRFLPGADRVVSRLDQDQEFDMTIMVDCAQSLRVSDEFAAHKKLGTIACIDHHMLEKTEAEVLLLDPTAASAGEVVMRLMKRAGLEADADVAQCIYTTLVVDTGFFKYSSTNAHVFELAAELVKAGAEPWEVAKHMDESYPASRMKLLARSLSTLEIDLGGRYATMEVSQDMLAATGATMEVSDEFATFPRSIQDVEVAALFRDLGDGAIKVSLRSKDIVDVSALARSMGGGGHARASGVRMRATMAEAKLRIKTAVEHALKG